MSKQYPPRSITLFTEDEAYAVIDKVGDITESPNINIGFSGRVDEKFVEKYILANAGQAAPNYNTSTLLGVQRFDDPSDFHYNRYRKVVFEYRYVPIEGNMGNIVKETINLKSGEKEVSLLMAVHIDDIFM